MAHIDMFTGEEILTEHDAAKEVFKVMRKQDFVKVNGMKTEKGVSLNVEAKKLPCAAGYYVIYYMEADKLICAYSGMSDNSIQNRIYRFVKELAGMSRKDEDHPAARLLRELGILKHTDDLYIKFMNSCDVDSIVEKVLGRPANECLDEHIANVSKAWTNKKVKKS